MGLGRGRFPPSQAYMICGRKGLPETYGRKFGSSAQSCLLHGYVVNSIGALAIDEENVRMLFRPEVGKGRSPGDGL